MRWWQALNTPRGVFWSRAVSAVFMVAFGLLVLVFGDQDQHILAGAALFIAFINVAMVVGQWHELRAGQAPSEGGRPPG